MKFIVIAFVLFFFIYVQAVMAQEPAVSYELPYAGLLPDNPLYSLKVLRDRVIGFLITDPLKKSQFDLLQADKRLNAGISLCKKKNYALAQSTMSKGENYLEQSMHDLEQAKKEKIDIRSLQATLLQAANKHEDVLEALEETSPSGYKGGFTSLHTRAIDIRQKISSLKS